MGCFQCASDDDRCWVNSRFARSFCVLETYSPFPAFPVCTVTHLALSAHSTQRNLPIYERQHSLLGGEAHLRKALTSGLEPFPLHSAAAPRMDTADVSFSRGV